VSEQFQGLDVHLFAGPDDWLAWLAEHHRQNETIWIKFAKKGGGHRSINYEQAREGALRYGWIDGQVKSLDKEFYLQRWSPRRPRSKWSQVNREIVEDLIARGLMFASGMQQVEAARADGRWDRAYAPPSKIEVPADFRQLLDRNPRAAEVFAKLKQMERYRILYRLQDAKKPETREKRKQQFLAELLQS
jgi:uncharacterized protein YdeI (YjbR/CyaY-like superfamily)